MSRIFKSTDLRGALRSRQRGFLLNPYRFVVAGGGNVITLGAAPVNASGSGVEVGVTFAGTTAGRSLVIGVCWSHATATLSSVTISGESNATIIGSKQFNSALLNHNLQIAYLSSLSAGGSKTITANFSASTAGSVIAALEFIGGDTGGFYDTGSDAGATGNNTTPTVNCTTSVANAMIFALCGSSGSDPTAGSGFTLYNIADSAWYDTSEYDLDVGAAGSKTVSFSATSAPWNIKVAAFKPVP